LDKENIFHKDQHNPSCSKSIKRQELTIFKYNPEAILYLDQDGKIIDLNPRFSQLFDYQLKDIKGETIDTITLFPEDKPNNLLSKIRQRFYGHQAQLKKKNGSLVDVEISASPIILKKNNLHGSLLSFKDITQRKENENLNSVLYNISKAANSNITLQELYNIIYKELNKVIDATNFHIALQDREKNKITFAYFVDQKDQIDKEANGFDGSDTLASYNIKYGKSLLVN